MGQPCCKIPPSLSGISIDRNIDDVDESAKWYNLVRLGMTVGMWA